MGVFSRKSNENSHPQSHGSVSPISPNIPKSSLTGSAAPQPLPFSTHRNITAAASIVDVSTSEAKSNYAKRRASAEVWQDEAWVYSDTIGEINYAFNVVANALSRVRLYAAEVVDPTSPPVAADPDKEAGQASIETLSRLNSAFGGIPGFMRDAAMNLQISGEALLVQRPANPFANPPVEESWDIRSVDEVRLSPEGRWMILPREDGDRTGIEVLPKNAFVARIWRPHPRHSDSATSSMRPVLDACAELLLINKTFRATARSRLNSGLLYLPDGLSVAGSEDPDAFASSENELADPDSTEAGAYSGDANDYADQSDTDEFEEALVDAMITPIADEESASAVVPLIVRGPEHLGEKIRLIQFERSFDPALADRADKILDRIMQGLDVPKEVIKGLSSLKFSSAQIVDIQLYQAHVEPLALLICDALTTVYLRPTLRALGLPEEEVRRHVVWYDPSDVTTRPNRAEDADQGYDNHLISGATWRRAHNFTDDDAPTSTELALRLLQEKGSITPELAESLLTVLAPEVMKAVRDATLSTQESSGTGLTPDIQQALSGEPPAVPQEPAAEQPEPPASPAPASDEIEVLDEGDLI